MKCAECKYKREDTYCDISHSIFHNPFGKKIVGCSIESDDDVSKMNICYNCKHWIGGGDWGLSCRKDYYVATSNGFREACKKFERKKYD